MPRFLTSGAEPFATIACPRCERPLRLTESHRLRAVCCPGCGAALSLAKSLPPAVDTPPATPMSTGVTAEASPSRLLHLVLAAPALLAVGIPLCTRGGFPGTGLAAGLALACLLLGLWPRWRPAVRLLLTLILMGLGYGVSFAVLVPDEPDSAQAMDSPATWPMLSPPIMPHEAMPGPVFLQILDPPHLVDLTFRIGIGDLLAVAVDPETGTAFVTRADGSLDCFSYPAFQAQGSCRLEQPGYRAVLDRRHGRLFLAVSDPQALKVNRYGDRPAGRGDLHVYADVRNLAAAGARGASATGDSVGLRPTAVVPLDGNVSRLLAAPDGSCLYYLLHRPDGDEVGRLPLVAEAPGAPPEVRWRPGGTVTALALSPDGAALYAAGPWVVHVLEPQALRERQRFPVEPIVFDLAADNAGRLFLSEAGQWTPITVVNARHDGAVLGRWNPRMHGRIYLQLTPDATRLYLGSSSLISNAVRGLMVQKSSGGMPPQYSHAVGDGTAPVRGEFFITPDGRHLITRTGKVLHLVGPPADQRPHHPAFQPMR
jgi:hypothetical protein